MVGIPMLALVGAAEARPSGRGVEPSCDVSQSVAGWRVLCHVSPCRRFTRPALPHPGDRRRLHARESGD
jgi:hypothetical protein